MGNKKKYKNSEDFEMVKEGVHNKFGEKKKYKRIRPIRWFLNLFK